MRWYTIWLAGACLET